MQHAINTMPMVDSLPLKFYLHKCGEVQEIKRLSVSSCDLTALRQLISTYSSEYKLRYLDDEGDLIDVTEEPEWCEAVRVWEEMGRETPLKLYIEAATTTTTTTTKRSKKKSKKRPVPITIFFRNETSKPAQLFWIDSKGGEKLYNVIQPNTTIKQATFSGHEWIIRQPDCLDRYFTSTELSHEVVVVAKEGIETVDILPAGVVVVPQDPPADTVITILEDIFGKGFYSDPNLPGCVKVSSEGEELTFDVDIPELKHFINTSAVAHIRLSEFCAAKKLLENGLRVAPDDVLFNYNMACVEALTCNTASALSFLRLSVDHGLCIPNILESDSDLMSLWRDEAFLGMAGEVNRKYGSVKEEQSTPPPIPEPEFEDIEMQEVAELHEEQKEEEDLMSSNGNGENDEEEVEEEEEEEETEHPSVIQLREMGIDITEAVRRLALQGGDLQTILNSLLNENLV